MVTCVIGNQFLVFKSIAKNIAEVNNYIYADSPYDAYKKKCNNIIIVDNLLQRTGFMIKEWKRKTNGNVILYVVTEGYPTITPRTGFGEYISDSILVTPSNYSKIFIEESGFQVQSIIPHGIKVKDSVLGYENREKRLYYRSYYIKRKFPPYGINAIKKAINEKLPVEIYIRDDMYPNGIEDRHKVLSQIIPVKIENSFNTTIDKVYESIEKSQFFLNLSDGGGFELEVLESMVLGTPVITAYFPPISEYYPKNELTIDIDGDWYEQYPYVTIKHHIYNPDNMLEKMKYALELEKEKWQSISDNLREISKKYDYKVVYTEFKKLLGE
jgi:glycosyltransferase involved in cell wall biosynthesis